MWASKLKGSLENHRPIIQLVRILANKIIAEHRGGQTEAFYEKMLSTHLYERGVPYLTQVDCFVQQGTTPVYVGRLDMEINHDSIIELKVGAKIRKADITQLMKYVRSRHSTGMRVTSAAVVCFREDDTVEIHEIIFQAPSSFSPTPPSPSSRPRSHHTDQDQDTEGSPPTSP